MGYVKILNYEFYTVYIVAQILLMLAIITYVQERTVRPSSGQERLKEVLLFWSGIVVVILFVDLGRCIMNLRGLEMSISYAIWYLESGITLGFYISASAIAYFGRYIWEDVNYEKR